jgi:hypothetical protein
MLWERAIACFKKWREHQGGMEHEGNSTENEGRCSKPEFGFRDIIYFHGGCYSAILKAQQNSWMWLQIAHPCLSSLSGYCYIKLSTFNGR